MASPQELRNIALQASRNEYLGVVEQLKKIAQTGRFSEEFPEISDGARQLLMEDGYRIEVVKRGTYGEYKFYKVSF